jgi:uncharacterized membrane protein
MNHPEMARDSVTNGKATASLILGVISIVLTLVPLGGLILGIVGLILGILGLKEIKRSEQAGKSLQYPG